MIVPAFKLKKTTVKPITIKIVLNFVFFKLKKTTVKPITIKIVLNFFFSGLVMWVKDLLEPFYTINASDVK